MATDKATNARLLKTYGITLEEYNQLLAAQDGSCKICRKPPGKVRLHVDHDHKLRYLKIESAKTYEGTWRAGVVYGDAPHQFAIAEGKTKSEAVRAVRFQLLKASVRGLLCWPCNSALRHYHDDPAKLRAAADYLEAYKAR